MAPNEESDIRGATPFERWAADEGIPVIRGYSVKDMCRVALAPWARKGGLGAFIILEGGEGWTSAYLCEIPPGVSLRPQRHLFEERIFVLQGCGETRVWNEGSSPQTFAWQENSLFSPPLNSWHQHTNVGKEPARYVAVTNAPAVFSLFGSAEFIFNCNAVLKDRYNGEQEYFDGIGKINQEGFWEGGLIPDVCKGVSLEGISMGEKFLLRYLILSRNRTAAHIAELAVGTYKKAHRHTGGAHIIIVNGKGYSFIWREGGERVRIDWQKGSIYSPPEGWFHHHFNTCGEPVRQVALRRGAYGMGKVYRPERDLKTGGDQLEYEDEDPEIRKLFMKELAREGQECRMTPVKR